MIYTVGGILAFIIELADNFGQYVIGCRVSITRNTSFELAKKEWLKIKGKS